MKQAGKHYRNRIGQIRPALTKWEGAECDIYPLTDGEHTYTLEGVQHVNVPEGEWDLMDEVTELPPELEVVRLRARVKELEALRNRVTFTAISWSVRDKIEASTCILEIEQAIKGEH